MYVSTMQKIVWKLIEDKRFKSVFLKHASRNDLTALGISPTLISVLKQNNVAVEEPLAKFLSLGINNSLYRLRFKKSVFSCHDLFVAC